MLRGTLALYGRRATPWFPVASYSTKNPSLLTAVNGAATATAGAAAPGNPGGARLFAPDVARKTFAPEISALEMHSSLLNQTTPSQLLELADVLPMLQLYQGLVEHRAGDLVVRKVAKALSRTAKDATFAFRAMPQSRRAAQQAGLFRKLRSALDDVAVTIVDGAVAADEATIAALYTAYEIVDPQAGIVLFRAIQQGAGLAIPCMLKAGVALPEITAAFAAEYGDRPDLAPVRAVANMAWALLRFGEVDEASKLLRLLMDERRDVMPPSVHAFLIDAFVGDAPAPVAMDVFRQYVDHAPHHASMTRMLDRVWDESHSVEEQIALFGEYLQRLVRPSELSIKTVSMTVVRHIVEGSHSPEDALDRIVVLSRIYDAHMSDHTVLLNVLLTEVVRRWTGRDEARDLVLSLLSNYDAAADVWPVSYRVRLNALETLSDVESVALELWTARTSRPGLPPVEKLDWLALARGTNAGQLFVNEWLGAGAPFERDIRRFCASKGYSL